MLSYKMNVIEEQMQTLRDLVSQHKTVRYGVLLQNAHQTVENHTNRMLALAPVISDIVGLSFGINELNALILAHDLPELGMEKDITVFEQIQVNGAEKRKDDIEAKTKLALVDKYGQWLKDLFDKYEKQESEIAKFVKWLDRYEASRHMLEIHAYNRLQHQSNLDYVPFVLNTERLIKATKEIPSLLKFTINHLEQELAPAFARNNKKDKYNELRAKLSEF